jgi:antitoxin component of RelBE/YafQ-DinJ toxin-antitoxin module
LNATEDVSNLIPFQPNCDNKNKKTIKIATQADKGRVQANLKNFGHELTERPA